MAGCSGGECGCNHTRPVKFDNSDSVIWESAPHPEEAHSRPTGFVTFSEGPEVSRLSSRLRRANVTVVALGILCMVEAVALFFAFVR